MALELFSQPIINLDLDITPYAFDWLLTIWARDLCIDWEEDKDLF